MQRDHYLPLKVISEHLDAIDRGLEPPPIEPVVPTVPKVALAADGLPSADVVRPPATTCGCRARELVKIAEITEELLDQLEQFGLISPRPGTGHYDADALVIAQTAARAGRLRLRAAAPAGVQDRRRPRGRAGRAGRRARSARPRRGREGPRRGGRQRDRGAVGAAARDPGQGRSALAPDAGPGRRGRARPRSRVKACAKSTSSESGSRCPPTSRSCCCARSTGERYLPIWIGAVEATAIAFAQQGVVPPRPLTHDLLKDVLDGHRQRARPRSGSPR